ncbi:hypothetical protein [uncultured Rhodospira sp.]|uniref:hypothetical protein n=1 Tax=uncultured Rhodospira sp. TaxID=1936189 RepID=UPI00262A6660|nr:hypothetical protein [uncultured Rhodospira sp.]
MLGSELADATRVLVVSERPNRLRSLVDSLRNSSNQTVKAYALAEPLRLAHAVSQINPDVIVTDAWYDRSRADFWRYLKPIKDARPDTKIIILENEGGVPGRKPGGQSARVLRLDDKTIIPRQKIRDGGVVAEEVARYGQEASQRVSGRMRRAYALVAG